MFSADPPLIPDILRTGAEVAEISAADHVCLGTTVTTNALSSIAVGSDLYPDYGATVVIRVSLGRGPALRLTGPGIGGALTVWIDGLADGFWTARSARLRYPMGFDLFLLDGTSVLGLPRSMEIEVL